jgi:hypothetical protein
MLVLLKGRIYDVGRRDGVRCHNIHIDFHKVRFRPSEVRHTRTLKINFNVSCRYILRFLVVFVLLWREYRGVFFSVSIA